VLFGAAILTAALRGHYAYGATVFGQPTRLVAYAAIIVTLAGMTVQSVYRLLLWVFYTGTFVTTVLAVFYIATGTSQTDQVALSTGGARILGISVTLYAAATVFLALLSLRIAKTGHERALHLFMAGIGLFCVVVGFGRAVYLSVALVCLLFFVLSRQIRVAVLSVIPLLLPFIVLFAMFLPKMAPDLVDSIGHRVSAAPATDANVQWRVKASRAVFEQIREEPVFGVGFGQVSSFFVDVQSSAGWLVPVYQESGQDPHNGYLYLWAGGGLAALGGFLLLIAVFVVDTVRRYRGNHDPTGRLLLLWSGASVGAFLLNTLSGTTFGNPPDLLCIWALLVLPSIVPYHTPEEALLEDDVRGGGEPDPTPPAGPRRPTPATA
jgi:O-antigen ligase